MKENLTLKEKRASPEKLEELDRYRNQVLECSKCITALRQSSMEKDRRYDLLLQKFKRIRKCILQRKNGEIDEDLFSSFGGSDGSWDSTISLNTITEDLREPLDRITENVNENLCLSADDNHNIAYLQRLPNEPPAYCIGDNKAYPRSSDGSSKRSSQYEKCMYSSETVQRLQNQIISMQENIDLLHAELTNAKDTNELLEFQLLENNEDAKNKFEELLKKREQVDKAVKTEDFVNDMSIDSAVQSASTMETTEVKQQLSDMRMSANLNEQQRAVVVASKSYIDNLEQENCRIDSCLMELKEKELIIRNLEKEIDNERQKQAIEKQQCETINELQKKLEDLTVEKEAMSEKIESLVKVIAQKDTMLQNEKNYCSKLEKQVEDTKADEQKEMLRLRLKLKSAEEEVKNVQKKYKELTEERAHLFEDIATLNNKLQSAHSEIEALKLEVRPAIRTELERRYEETRYRVKCSVEEKHELQKQLETMKQEVDRLQAEAAEVAVLRNEVDEHREYAEQLERQFTAQVAIIEALKKKLLEQRSATGKNYLSIIDQSSDMDDAKSNTVAENVRDLRGNNGITIN
uniref:GRIP domain-containing protein n=1 Tax=Syphacia muris TaxID=451379 RepID=A0A0N5ARD1_9BILA